MSVNNLYRKYNRNKKSAQMSGPQFEVVVPILNAIAEDMKLDLSSFEVVMFLHFLPDLIPALEVYEKQGVRKELATLVPVFYSKDRAVVEDLAALGWTIIEAKKNEASKEVLELVLLQALDRARSANRKCLIIQDGGDPLRLLLDKYPDLVGLIAGVCEQTARGVKIDREAIARFEDDYGPIPFTVSAVGESPLKKKFESFFVGDAIIHNVDRLLRGVDKGLRGKRIAVIGFGDLGSRLATFLRAHLLNVGVVDSAALPLFEALLSGFNLPATEDGYLHERAIYDFLNEHSIVIGITGGSSITADFLADLEKDIILVSGSSKRIEIDVGALERMAFLIEPLAVGTRYFIRNRKGKIISVTLLNDGYPANFNRNSESVPTEHIQFVYALILGEVERIVNGPCPSGLVLPSQELEEKIARLCLKYMVG